MIEPSEAGPRQLDVLGVGEAVALEKRVWIASCFTFFATTAPVLPMAQQMMPRGRFLILISWVVMSLSVGWKDSLATIFTRIGRRAFPVPSARRARNRRRRDDGDLLNAFFLQVAIDLLDGHGGALGDLKVQ